MFIRSRYAVTLLLALLVTIGAVAVLIATGKINGCSLGQFGSEHEPEGGALCRAEFLVDRYQALIGALIALAAAFYAARPVWQQLRLMRVQAASGALPQLQQEAGELLADENFLATASQIADRLREAAEKAGGTLSGADVGAVIGLLMPVRTAIYGMKSDGRLHQFAHRNSLHSSEQERRKSLLAVIDEISEVCERIMSVANPPVGGLTGYGGQPREDQYAQIAPSFAEAIREAIPTIIERLNSDISTNAAEVRKMKTALQVQTELAIQTAKDFSI